MENSRNPLSYNSIAKWLHWLMALLIFVSYCAIYYREWLADSEFESWLTIQLHFSVGITLGILVIPRMVLRCLNPTPNYVKSSRLQRFAATMVHFALYIAMIIMPISGYLSIADYLSRGGKIDYFFFYNITWFKGVELPSFMGISLEQLEDPAAIIHSLVGEWLMLFLIIFHVLAALYHHFILKDEILLKMTLFKHSKPRGEKL